MNGKTDRHGTQKYEKVDNKNAATNLNFCMHTKIFLGADKGSMTRPNHAHMYSNQNKKLCISKPNEASMSTNKN